MLRHPGLLCAAIALALGCGGGSGSSGLQQALTDFEKHAQQAADSLSSIYADTVALDAALKASDTAPADALLDRIPKTLDTFDAATKALQLDEQAIQAALAGAGAGSALVQRLEEKKGFFASLRKMLDIGAKYRELSDSMTKAREDRDQAREDVMNNVSGAQERLSDANSRMVTAGQGAMQELGTSVTVEAATTPIKPVTLVGTVFKTAAKGAFKKGLTAITSTKPCETDVTSPSCTVGVAKTDENGQVKAPVSTSSIVVSGGGIARVRVDTLDVKKDPPRKEVTREQVPIAEATRATVTRGDETDGIDDEDERKIRPLWMLCESSDASYQRTSVGCYLFDGDTFAWNAGYPERADWDAWCAGQGQMSWYTDFYSEASCREACRLLKQCVTP